MFKVRTKVRKNIDARAQLAALVREGRRFLLALLRRGLDRLLGVHAVRLVLLQLGVELSLQAYDGTNFFFRIEVGAVGNGQFEERDESCLLVENILVL